MNYSMSYMEQPGAVIGISAGRIKVAILGNTGCSACHSSLCLLGASEARQFEVNQPDNIFKIGEAVRVRVNPGSAYTGLFWLYVLPSMTMLLVLTGSLAAGYSEPAAGILSLIVLIPYFVLVFVFRRKLARKCIVSITKK